MITINFVIICESAIIEKDTNNLYILGSFGNIFVPGVPALQPSFAVVTNFKGGDGVYKHRILIKHEAGDEIVRLDGKITFASGQNAQYIGKFIGLRFPKLGKYYVEIYIDETLQPLVGELNVILRK